MTLSFDPPLPLTNKVVRSSVEEILTMRSAELGEEKSGIRAVEGSRAPGPHAHGNTARQAMDGLWTEAR